MNKLRLVSILFILFLALVPLTYSNSISSREAFAATPSEAAKIVQLVKPSVVEVLHLYNISISAPVVGIDVDALVAKANELANAGRLDISDTRTVLAALGNLIFNDPTTYVIPSKTKAITFILPEGATGSGFVATSDGYVVTNAHVVLPPTITEVTALMKSGQGEIFHSQSINTSIEIIRGLFAQGFPGMASLDLSSDDVLPLVSVLDKYYQAYSHVNGIVDSAMIVVSKSRFGDSQNTQAVFAHAIPQATGESGGKDVAILKIDMDNLPTLSLGDESTLNPLDDLITIGYPGSVTNTLSTISKQTISSLEIEPSIAKGQFSGLQPSGAGFNYVEVEIPQAHGSSGSPVVDLSGNVVGIITLGTIDEGGSSPFGLLIPASVVKEYLEKAGVNTQQQQSIEGIGTSDNGNNNNNTNDAGSNGAENGINTVPQPQTPSGSIPQGNNTSLLTYDNASLGITLKYPSNWILKEGFSGENSVRFLDNGDAKDQFAKSLDVLVDSPGTVSYYPSNKNSLQDVAEELIKALNDSLKDFKLSSQRPGPTIDGNPSIILLYTFTDPNIGNSIGLHVITTGTSNLYEFVYTVSANEVKKEQIPIVMETITSFKAR